MENIRDPWHVTLTVAIVMLVLHLTIVPIAWVAAQILDFVESVRMRRPAPVRS